MTSIRGADLNHVALANEQRAPMAARYAGELGGTPTVDGPSPGFWWAQVSYANGMVLEMLEPHHPEENDFLRRFLDRNGPGPHHLTFTVPDFEAALGAVTESGYSPVGVNTSDPDWKEAFLHPKDAPGVVVQLAESHEDHGDAGPAGAQGTAPAASLVHVCHAVRRMEDGTRLFEGMLGGVRTGQGAGKDGDGEHQWVELEWPGPGRLRVVSPTGPGPLDDWLGTRAGRVRHIAFELPDPARVSGAARDGDRWVVEPGANLGARLVLREAPG